MATFDERFKGDDEISKIIEDTANMGPQEYEAIKGQTDPAWFAKPRPPNWTYDPSVIYGQRMVDPNAGRPSHEWYSIMPVPNAIQGEDFRRAKPMPSMRVGSAPRVPLDAILPGNPALGAIEQFLQQAMPIYPNVDLPENKYIVQEGRGED